MLHGRAENSRGVSVGWQSRTEQNRAKHSGCIEAASLDQAASMVL